MKNQGRGNQPLKQSGIACNLEKRESIYEELFVTTKPRLGDALKRFVASNGPNGLERLQLDYADLY